MPRNHYTWYLGFIWVSLTILVFFLYSSYLLNVNGRVQFHDKLNSYIMFKLWISAKTVIYVLKLCYNYCFVKLQMVKLPSAVNSIKISIFYVQSEISKTNNMAILHCHRTYVEFDGVICIFIFFPLHYLHS